ncbi:MAG: hypothetical protein MPI91_01510 [Nitrosopumilus sp.]|nr:hypothetical protein [Nitrosopumilus sp.]
MNFVHKGTIYEESSSQLQSCLNIPQAKIITHTWAEVDCDSHGVPRLSEMLQGYDA